jgi:hypothetical protein
VLPRCDELDTCPHRTESGLETGRLLQGLEVVGLDPFPVLESQRRAGDGRSTVDGRKAYGERTDCPLNDHGTRVNVAA